MIKIKRTKKPQILVNNEHAWLVAFQAATSVEEKKTKAARYKHKDIRKELEKMSFEKCSYCESSIAHVTYGHIEHFRPWSKYPKSIFNWKNLLLSCPICNGKQYKSNNFPTAKDGGPIINPSAEDPSLHLSFGLDPTSKQALVISKTTRGATTEKFLGLNRPHLIKQRSDYLRKLIALKTYENTDAEAAEILQEALALKSPYLAFCRSLLV